jgi:peroxiredoxin
MSFFNKNFFAGFGIGVFVTIIVEVLLIIMLVFAVRSSMGSRMSAQLAPPDFPAEIKKADVENAEYNLSMTTLDNKPYPLELAKGKVVFLNFWATWCPPCKAEMPGMQRMYDQLSKEGLVMVCVSNENSKTVQKFIKEYKYQFPVYTIQDSAIPGAYVSNAIPITYIISKDGKIVFKHSGSAKWDDPKSIEFLRKLLKE